MEINSKMLLSLKRTESMYLKVRFPLQGWTKFMRSCNFLRSEIEEESSEVRYGR